MRCLFESAQLDGYTALRQQLQDINVRDTMAGHLCVSHNGRAAVC